MTVIINVPPGDALEELARNVVDKAIEAENLSFYDSGLRQRAIECILNYQPAYVKLSTYSDNLGSLVCCWAMGLQQGLPSIDPVRPLAGMREVAKHMQLIWPKDWDEKLRKALRNIQPVNAMAELDRELLLTEYGINPADVDFSKEASEERAKKET